MNALTFYILKLTCRTLIAQSEEPCVLSHLKESFMADCYLNSYQKMNSARP